MDFDSSYIDPLITDWMEHLQQSLKEHAELHSMVQGCMAFSAIPESVVGQFFDIANFLNLKPNVKWLAIQLYDLYVIKRFIAIYKLSVLHNSIEAWTQSVEETCSKANLLVLSCFKIASKMESHNHCLGLSQFYATLRMMGDLTEYSPSMIFSSEVEVFKQIEFKVSFCTPLQCLEILLAATGLVKTPCMYEASLSVLDIAYSKHETLYSQFCLKLTSALDADFVNAEIVNAEFAQMRVIELKKNMLHMSSAIILCTTLFIRSNPMSELHELAFTTKLAEFSNTTYIDITIMATVLLEQTYLGLENVRNLYQNGT